jgi:hypothetical protein
MFTPRYQNAEQNYNLIITYKFSENVKVKGKGKVVPVLYLSTTP